MSYDLWKKAWPSMGYQQMNTTKSATGAHFAPAHLVYPLSPVRCIEFFSRRSPESWSHPIPPILLLHTWPSDPMG